MATVQKTIQYEGDASALTNFPELQKVKLEFSVPTYNFKGKFGHGTQPIKEFSGNKTLVEFAKIGQEYKQIMPSTYIVAGNPKSFWEIYHNQKDTLEFNIVTTINNSVLETYKVRPLLLLTGNLQLLLGISRLENHIEPTEADVRKYLEENLVLINSNIYSEISSELQIILPVLSFLIRKVENQYLYVPLIFEEFKTVFTKVYGENSFDIESYNRLVNFLSQEKVNRLF